jgi:hypothetical protein
MKHLLFEKILIVLPLFGQNRETFSTSIVFFLKNESYLRRTCGSEHSLSPGKRLDRGSQSGTFTGIKRGSKPEGYLNHHLHL